GCSEIDMVLYKKGSLLISEASFSSRIRHKGQDDVLVCGGRSSSAFLGFGLCGQVRTSALPDLACILSLFLLLRSDSYLPPRRSLSLCKNSIALARRIISMLWERIF